MSTHEFIESTTIESQHYFKVIYCKRCGQITWNFNWNRELNLDLQSKMKPCISDIVVSGSPTKISLNKK